MERCAKASLMAYAGQRSVTQFLAIAPATQANPRHGGGVVNFDRNYHGMHGRLRFAWAQVDLLAGLEVERMVDARRGHENFTGPAAAPTALGVAGALRRDERNTAASRDAFVQAAVQWSWANWPTGRMAAAASTPRCGRRRAGKWSWVASGAAIPWIWMRRYSTSAPTTRSASIPTPAAGSRSRTWAARCATGAELAAAWRINPAWRSSLALTWLAAGYRDAFLACAGIPCAAPTVPVNAGNRITGTPRSSAFAELAWRGAGEAPLEAAVQWCAQGRPAVNDVNSDFAAGYGMAHLRLLRRQPLDGKRAAAPCPSGKPA
jgi:iron complex outermembrane recepter protein